MNNTRHIPATALTPGECLIYAGSYSALVLRARPFKHPAWGDVTEVLIQETPFKTAYLWFYAGQNAEIAV